jgi:hypothetical protein
MTNNSGAVGDDKEEMSGVKGAGVQSLFRSSTNHTACLHEAGSFLLARLAVILDRNRSFLGIQNAK